MLHHQFKQLNKAVVTAITVGAVLFSTSCAFSQISAQLTATKAQVATFLGTTSTALKAKMVFVNAGYLFLIDYSQATPTMTKMDNTIGAIVPMISPDGNWVVYAKGPASEMGGTVASSAYVSALSASATPVVVAADSAYQPRFKINSNTMTVIYSSQDKLESSWNGLGKTYETTVLGGVPSNVQTVLYGGGSYYGGLSWDHRYLCSGQQRPVIKDITDNSTTTPAYIHQLLFTRNGVESIRSIQVCNPSVSPSRIFTNVMMYYDFGKQGGFTHSSMSSWGLHTRMFIGNSNNEILKYWDVPAPVKAMVSTATIPPIGAVTEVKFLTPEWSNHPYYSVSSIEITRTFGSATTGFEPKTSKNEKIYLFNLKDSTSIELATTTDSSLTTTTNIYWPWFWTEIPANFTESTTWLSTVKVPNQATAVITPMHPRTAFSAIRFDNNTIIAEKVLSSVTVYSLNGTMVKSIRPEGKRVTLSELAPKTSGMFTIVACDKAGNTETFQWSKIDR